MRREGGSSSRIVSKPLTSYNHFVHQVGCINDNQIRYFKDMPLGKAICMWIELQ